MHVFFSNQSIDSCVSDYHSHFVSQALTVFVGTNVLISSLKSSPTCVDRVYVSGNILTETIKFGRAKSYIRYIHPLIRRSIGLRAVSHSKKENSIRKLLFCRILRMRYKKKKTFKCSYANL